MKDCFKFSDPRDICIGAGRIVWATRLLYDGFRDDMQGVVYQAGWVLPGGRRTQSKEEAEHAASAINDAINEASKAKVAATRNRVKS